MGNCTCSQRIIRKFLCARNLRSIHKCAEVQNSNVEVSQLRRETKINYSWVSCEVIDFSGVKSEYKGTVIRANSMFKLCVDLVLVSKNVQFHIIC